MEYLAKYNKVWKNVKTGEVLTNRLKLKDDESLSDYTQVPKPKEAVKEPAKKKTSKEPQFFAENKTEGVF